MKIIIIALVLVIIISDILTQKKNDYALLLEWGKNNSVFISDKIAMNYTNENIKNYYVKKKIKKDETIMSIPRKILLNIDSALNLSNPKIKKQFEIYKKEDFRNKQKDGINEILPYRIDQSFLAYLMTIANKNKSPKSKFYQFYKYFFNTFETDVEKYPIFYNSDQIRLLMFSLFGNELMETKEMFDEEYDILQRKIYKKNLDQDEYYKHRIFSFNKLVNISGVSSLVPFLDMIETHPINYNLQVNYTESNDSLAIVAIKDITVKDKLFISVVQMQNSNSLITYGKVYNENKHYVESFKIAKVFTNFLREKKLDPFLASTEIVDLTEKNYYKQILPIYTDLSIHLKEDGSKTSALRLFLENMQSIRKTYDTITPSVLYKNFFQTKYVLNVKSVLDTEKYYLDKKIRELKILINKVAANKELDTDL
jgi:hypothetical protein